MIQVHGESVQSDPVIAVASAPVRTADVGGWTDTWFAGQGAVCNLALPLRVTVMVHEGSTPDVVDPLLVHLAANLSPDRPTWLEVHSDVPSGSGLGTSAALSVAAVAAMKSWRGETLQRDEVAAAAHRLEVGSGRESGVQDHWASAHGGVSLLTIDYPRCRRERMDLDPLTVQLLARRLHTVCFARAHSSNDLHLGVIERVSAGFGVAELERMRQAAVDAAVALETRDLQGFGDALVVHHECMRRLDERLVSAEADSVATEACRLGARGWKVNGAGGAGGSMVVLGPEDADADARLLAMLQAIPGAQVFTGAIDERGVVVH